MTAFLARRCAGRAVLAGLFILASAEPAFAQDGGVGGNIGTFIQNIINILNSSVIRGLAIIAIASSLRWWRIPLSHTPATHGAGCSRKWSRGLRAFTPHCSQ